MSRSTHSGPSRRGYPVTNAADGDHLSKLFTHAYRFQGGPGPRASQAKYTLLITRPQAEDLVGERQLPSRPHLVCTLKR